MCGKPPGAAGPRLIAFSDIKRPLTEMCLLVVTTKRSKRCRKLARWKKLPLKPNVNNSVGKPAGPTATPGGSAAVAAAEVALDAGAEVGAGADAVPGVSCRLRKSTRAPL